MPASFAPVIEAFLYQFVSLPMGQIGQSSALYATTYFVRNIFGTLPAVAVDDTPTFSTYQNDRGLLSVLQAALTASGVSAQTGSPVTAVAPGRDSVAVTAGGTTIDARYVVLACNPNTSAMLLASGGTASQDLVQLLHQFPYLELPVVLQQNGSCWMPGDSTYWEPVNTVVNTPDQTITFSAWLGALRPPYGSGQQIPVFKSWGAPGLDPASCSSAFYSHSHNVLLPTTTFMQLRRQLLSAYQGQNGLFFAGGWTTWFDSQEAALLSAMDIVGRLSPPAGTSAPFKPAVAFDGTALPVRVKAWLEMVLSRKTGRHENRLVELIARLS
jgi:predicted NAD/FAD-binding protein